MKVQKKQRFMELEGLRGVAAIAVVLYHYLLAFYAFAFFGSGTGAVQNMRLEDNLYGNPIMVFLSGTFAVAIFFVLSGFVLSIGFFQTGKLDIIKKLAAKRYLRLMIPALASIIVCYLIFAFGVSHIRQTEAITHSVWLAQTWNFVPNLGTAIWGGLVGIFSQSSNGYNNVLWTMTTEFVGSFIVFGVLALFGKIKYRSIVYVFLVIATFNSWLLAFIVGMIMADLYTSGYLQQKQRSLKSFLTVAIALFLGGYPMVFADHTIYGFITVPGLTVNWQMLYLTIGATLLVGSVLTIKQVATIFSKKTISRLGQYTFSLYLIHLSVLYGFTTLVFVELRLRFGLGFNASTILAIISSIPVLIGATLLFEKYVDASSIKFSSYVANIVLGYQQVPKVLQMLKSLVGRVKRNIKKSPPLVPQEEIE